MNAPRLTPIATALFALGLAAGAPSAQEIVPPGPSGRGALLIYGNFCGPGNRGPGYAPIDALDRACAHHDACWPQPASGLLPACACNRRLQVEAGLVARDPHAPLETQQTARFIADFATALPCEDASAQMR
ncbi:hypothetical protein MKL09_18800 [Methylobacterium sp. J-048]|uniref:hypothetical protein n=1 Tax=Methylobacterium sp. J-048 TaxID=2836635 RepID=UPI001FBB3BD8|nr:hypothetical protein [Methylobacterium sp. J-048]MCJ2058589.1 hypothetical protein [Methylobacterium sp. J-048]